MTSVALPNTRHNSAGTGSFELLAGEVLAELRAALGLLIESLPTPVANAAQLQRALGVDSKLAWQAFRVATAPTPLAAGVAVPARASIVRLVAKAKETGTPHAVLQRVLGAFSAFERFVADHAGDRREFEALAAAWSPEEAERLHLANREAIYRAAGHIRGAVAETAMFTRILCPGAAQPGMIDTAALHVILGLRRLRRGARIERTIRGQAAADAVVTSVAGEPMDPFAHVMLDQFCSSPTPLMTAHVQGQQRRYVLEGDEVGIKSAVDVVFADSTPGYGPCFGTRERPMAGGGASTDCPSRRLILDILVCEGLIEPQRPLVSVYDAVPHGFLSRFPDPARATDEVVVDVEPRAMGRGLESFRSVHVPRYVDMLAHICQKRGWDGSRLEGYRVEIEYPVYSWQAVMAFLLPKGP